ncbi:MAG: hypothetical protein ACP5UI_02410 [Thermoprotei archaeon]|nr:hypothetical protein [TACK group archaeon]
MKEISARRVLLGMLVVFLVGFAAGWYAWYLVYPHGLVGSAGDSQPKNVTAGWTILALGRLFSPVRSPTNGILQPRRAAKVFFKLKVA